jgi:hypothetical protein
LILGFEDQIPLAARMAIPTNIKLWSAAPRTLAVFLSLLLLTASVLKLWSQTRYHFPPPARSWMDGQPVSTSAAIGKAALGLVLLAGLWPRKTWLAAVSIFALFALITATESLQDKDSCGCFGTLQVRPIYTLFLDLTAVALLLATGPPKVEMQKSEGRRQNGEARRGRLIIAAVVAVAWVATVLAMWVTRPVVAVATTANQGQTFGNPGELVVLEPEKWAGQYFSLVDHIDVGSQLLTGQWIVLLVHHDCDHCAAAVPRYVAAEESQKAEGRRQRAE